MHFGAKSLKAYLLCSFSSFLGCEARKEENEPKEERNTQPFRAAYGCMIEWMQFGQRPNDFLDLSCPSDTRSRLECERPCTATVLPQVAIGCVSVSALPSILIWSCARKSALNNCVFSFFFFVLFLLYFAPQPKGRRKSTCKKMINPHQEFLLFTPFTMKFCPLPRRGEQRLCSKMYSLMYFKL